MKIIPKPLTGEYAPYTSIYMNLVPDDGLVLQHLSTDLETTKALLSSVPDSRVLFRYAEGKWTIKEIIGHLIDDERIYVYRALRFARNDATELPGFEQNHYAKYSGANERGSADLLNEFAIVRQSTIAFFATLDDDALIRSGIADGSRVTVRALVYHIAGHELHHLKIINERYLKP